MTRDCTNWIDAGTGNGISRKAGWIGDGYDGLCEKDTI